LGAYVLGKRVSKASKGVGTLCRNIILTAVEHDTTAKFSRDAKSAERSALPSD
jgi:hypothetical protein